jgi:hypothetical protein
MSTNTARLAKNRATRSRMNANMTSRVCYDESLSMLLERVENETIVLRLPDRLQAFSACIALPLSCCRITADTIEPRHAER